MQTNLAPEFRDTPDGREADAILRTCVHCGFCTATCPTYQLLGDELDGPRGRIYLIKQVLEGEPVTREDAAAPRPLPHLPQLRDDLPVRRAVRPPARHRPRASSSAKVGRTPADAAQRWRLRRDAAVAPAVRRRAAHRRAWSRACCRASSATAFPAAPRRARGPRRATPRKMLMLEGCVQPALKPNIDAATARVLDRIGISPLRVPGGGCCGALSHHLNADDEARAIVRRNIDAWWPLVHRGRRGDRRDRQRLRRDGQGLRPLPRARAAYAAKAQEDRRASRAIRSRS